MRRDINCTPVEFLFFRRHCDGGCLPDIVILLYCVSQSGGMKSFCSLFFMKQWLPGMKLVMNETRKWRFICYLIACVIDFQVNLLSIDFLYYDKKHVCEKKSRIKDLILLTLESFGNIRKEEPYANVFFLSLALFFRFSTLRNVFARNSSKYSLFPFFPYQSPWYLIAAKPKFCFNNNTTNCDKSWCSLPY